MSGSEQPVVERAVALRAVGLGRTYRTAAGDVVAVRQVDLEVRTGEFVALKGRSGSGKTTLLTMLAGLDVPTAGHIEIDGVELSARHPDQTALLSGRVASIFQGFGLLPILTAAENVEVPLRIRRVDPVERDARVAAALADVGLSAHAAQRPNELSGGQQQRVGIARALVGEPAVLLADEPTGQLDSETGEQVMELLARIVHERGMAAIVATHDPAMLARADRVLELHDGVLTEVARPGADAPVRLPAPASAASAAPAAQAAHEAPRGDTRRARRLRGE